MKTDFATLEAMIQLAEDRKRQGDFIGALEMYQALLEQRLQNFTNHPLFEVMEAVDIIIIERLADLAVLFGHNAAADDLLTAMVQLSEQAGNYYLADYTRLKQIHLALAHKQLRKAYQHLEGMHHSIGNPHMIEFSPLALPQWEARCHWSNTNEDDRAVLFSRLYLVMGLILSRLGQYGDALGALNQGLIHVQSDKPDLAQQAKIPLELAIVQAHLEKGDLANVQTHLNNIKPNLDKRGQPGFFTQWLEISAKFNFLRGEFGLALTSFKEVIDICRHYKFTQAALTAGLNLAHTLILLNQTSTAQEILTEVQAMGAKIENIGLVVRSTYLSQLAQARSHSMAESVSIAPSVYEMWLKPKAEQTNDRPQSAKIPAPLDIPQSDNYLAFFEDRALAFYWYLGYQNLTTATQYLENQLIPVFANTDSKLIQVHLAVLKGMQTYYQGNFEAAETIFFQLRPILHQMGLSPELWQVQRFLGWCLTRLGRSEEEQHRLTEETDLLLTNLTNSLPPSDQAMFMLNKWTAEEQFFAGEIDQLIAMKKEAITANRFLRPYKNWQIKRRLNELMYRIDHYKNKRTHQTVSGSNNEPSISQPISLWQRLWTHSRDYYTFSFLMLPDRLLTIQAGWFDLNFEVNSVTRIEVRDHIRRWHTLMAQANGRLVRSKGRGLFFGDDDEDSTTPEQRQSQAMEQSWTVVDDLAHMLQLPSLINSLPKHVNSIRFVPDDSLHGFPFAAMKYDGKHLIENYSLSIAFENHVRQYSSRTITKQKSALVVGVSQGGMGIRELPGVKKEIENLKQWLNHRSNPLPLQELCNAEANKQTVLECLPHVELLHIACHGIFEHNRPDASGLVLIPNPTKIEILSLRDLLNLDLSRLHHATLSSCWAADHFVLPGRWVISLPETLWRGGVRSILGNLWEVDDSIAIAFIDRFYHNLDSLSRSEALRKTQWDCLNNQLPNCNLDTSNPFYWAGYTLYGDNNYLKL